MEATIYGKRIELAATFAIEGASMNATIVIADGRLDSLGGQVTGGDGQAIGHATVNSQGQYYVSTDNGGSPAEISALIEQATAWAQNYVAGLAEQEQEEE